MSDDVKDLAGIRKLREEWVFEEESQQQQVAGLPALHGSDAGGVKQEEGNKEKEKEAVDEKKLLLRSHHAANSGKKKKKKSRRRSSSCTSESDFPRGVSWGYVEEVLFSRSPGMSVVPSQGYFPLGLGRQEGVHTLSVDDYCKLCSSVEGAEVSDDSNGSERVVRASSADDNSTNTEPQREGSKRHFFTKQYTASVSELENNNNNNNNGDKELSETVAYRAGVQKNLRPLTEDERRQVLAATTGEEAASAAAQLNDLTKELGLIQTGRLQTGCSCKPMKSDKLSVQKMKSELMAHGELIGLTNRDAIHSLSKAELQVHIRELLKKCPLCIDGSCECVVSGIGCSGETCGCLRKNGVTQENNPCGNPGGQYVFNSDFVNSYRRQVIERVLSQ